MLDRKPDTPPPLLVTGLNYSCYKFRFYPPPVGKGDFSRKRILSSVRRPASGVTFSCGRKNPKTTSHYFLKFWHDNLSNKGMCKWFFKDATKIQNATRGQLYIFFGGGGGGRKKLFKYYYHIPHVMEMCSCFLQGFTEIQNGRHRSTLIIFFGGGGLKNPEK